MPGKPMTDSFDPLLTLKLSIQRALLGEVTPRLVSVTCGIRGRVVRVRCYVSGQITDQDTERTSRIAGEVIADFPDGYLVEECCQSIENESERMLDFWAFRKAGP